MAEGRLDWLLLSDAGPDGSRKHLSRTRNLAGQKFGRWDVLRYGGKGHHHRWICRCECGEERDVESVHLVSGKSVSCGCHRDEVTGRRVRTHGMTETTEYATWSGIKFRTENPEHPSGEWYAKRGIKMCDRWKHSFENFLEDMGMKPGPEYSIDRIDNDGDYEPGNCRWATDAQQMRNTRKNRLVSFNGREMTLIEASELSGINYGTLKWRLNAGREPFAAVRKSK